MNVQTRTAKPPRTAREAALHILTRVESDRSYSNLLLHQTLKKSGLPRADAALATELVYGTIQRLLTLDYYLGRFVTKGVSSLEPWVRCLLRLSLYQLLYLDKVPPHAAVNEAVNLAKAKGHAGISGMVNAVLRNALRKKAELTLPPGLPPAERISLEHSHPLWMVERWLRRFGAETAERICEANNRTPASTIRANPLKLSRDELIERLRGGGLAAEPSPVSPSGVRVTGGGNLALADEFAAGLYSVQDESSMLVAEAVDPLPGMRVLDCCAAPGGKSAHMAERMNNDGEVVSCDVHEHKEKLIREQAERLGLTCIRTVAADARDLKERFPPQSFDRILLDAPCSGLGVIRRKPDLKWSKTEAEIAAVCELQRELLAAVHGLLKPGGILVYSTCTIAEEENEGVVEPFLRRHPAFRLEPFPERLRASAPPPRLGEGMWQILPQDFGSDGFFIARLKRTDE